MSRFYFSSDEKWDQRAGQICERAGLVSLGRVSDDFSFLRTYRKRSINNQNFFRFDDGDWVAITGTLFFDNTFGTDALEPFYYSFKRNGLFATRKNSSGHFAAIVSLSDQVYFFTDDQGSYSLYYFFSKEKFFVSNSLHVVAEILEKTSKSFVDLLLYCFQIDHQGNDTHLEGVKRLFGTEHIEFSGNEINVIFEDRPWTTISEQSDFSFDQTLKSFISLIDDTYSCFSSTTDIGLHLTGGMDSRTVLGSLLRQGIRPKAMCGYGNNSIIAAIKKDLSISKELSSRFGLDFLPMDWSGHHPHDETYWKEVFVKYGFLFTTYGSADRFIEGLETKSKNFPKLQITGYGAATTNSKPWNLEQRTYFFDELIDSYIAKDSLFLKPHLRKSYRALLTNKVKEALEKAPGRLLKEEFDFKEFIKARTFLHIRADSKAINFFNEFGFYASPFVWRKQYEPLVSINPEYRKNDYFQLKLNQELYSGLNDVVFMTAAKNVKVDKSSTPSLPFNLITFLFIKLRHAFRNWDKSLLIKTLGFFPYFGKILEIVDPRLSDLFFYRNRDYLIRDALYNRLSKNDSFCSFNLQGANFSSLNKMHSFAMLSFIDNYLTDLFKV